MNMIFCHIIVYLIEALILWQYSSSLFHIKYTKRLTYISLLFLYSLLLLIYFLNIFWLNAIAFLLFNFIFIFFFYNIKLSTALFHSAISSIMINLAELIMGSIFSDFLKNFYEVRSDSIVFYACYAFLTEMLYFLPMYLLSHLFPKPKEFRQNNDKVSLWLITIPLISLWLIMTLLGVCHTAATSPFLDKMITLSAALILFINILIWALYSYIQNKNSEFTELQLKLQRENDIAEYYKMLLNQNENQNILIHDIKNHLQSIAQLNQQGETDKIADYINKIIHSSNLQSSVSVCSNEFLNIILCRYIHICEEHRVSLLLDIRKDTVDFLTYNDLTGLFCNLLDNALESAKGQPDAFIELKVMTKRNTSFIVLTMENSCGKNPFTTGNKLISMKKNSGRHGFGMKSIKRIVENYAGDLKVYYSDEDKTFHTIIILEHAAHLYPS